MAPDYDALSDGSELTGEDSSTHSDHDEEAMPSAPHTPSKKRRRLVRAVQDDDDEEDEDQVADQLDDDDDDDDEDAVVDEGDELEEDDDHDYDTPSSSRKGARSLGRRTPVRAAAATPKRSARTSTRTAAASAATTTPTTSAKKSLRVKLTRTPNAASAAAKEESESPAPTPPAPRGRPPRSAAAGRKPKDSTKVKWKPRGKGKQSDSEDEIPATPSDDEQLEDDLIDPSRSATVDPDLASDSPGSDSEPDEATAAEMRAIIGKTARQLAREGGVESEHMELPMFDPNRKKKLTENEIALRRSETARKRKNQVEKKLEDDKVETINRLLKKQVGRSRNKLPRAGSGEDSDEEAEQARKRGREELSRKALKEMPAPFYRFIDRADGSKVLAVPIGPPLVEEIWGSNYVEVNTALVQELDTPVKTEGVSEKAKLLEERARKRLKQQAEVWKEEQELEQAWGQEGLYEYKLRSALGQSRKDWIGSRPPPTPEKEPEAEEQQEAEEEEAAEGENEAEEAANDDDENKEEDGDDAEAE